MAHHTGPCGEAPALVRRQKGRERERAWPRAFTGVFTRRQGRAGTVWNWLGE